MVGFGFGVAEGCWWELEDTDEGDWGQVGQGLMIDCILIIIGSWVKLIGEWIYIHQNIRSL